MPGSIWPCAARAERPTNNNVRNNTRGAQTTIGWPSDSQQSLLSIPRPQTVFPCEDLMVLTGSTDVAHAPYPQELSDRFSLVGNSPYWTHFRDQRAGLLLRFNHLRFSSAHAGMHGSEHAARTLAHQADCIRVQIAHLDSQANDVFKKENASPPGSTLPRMRAVVHLATGAVRDAKVSAERAECARAQIERTDLAVIKQPPLAPGMGLMWNKYIDKRNSLLHEVKNLASALNKLSYLARSPQNTDSLAAQEQEIGHEIECVKRRIKALDQDIEVANAAAMKAREHELVAVAKREMADYELRTGMRLGPHRASLEGEIQPEPGEQPQPSDVRDSAVVVHMPSALELPPPLAALRALPDPEEALLPFALATMRPAVKVRPLSSACFDEPYFDFTSVYVAQEPIEPLTHIGDQSLVPEPELPAG